jgi:hypothetical protein
MRDGNWEEYQVKVRVNGVIKPDMTYFTGDCEDAEQTAEAMRVELMKDRGHKKAEDKTVYILLLNDTFLRACADMATARYEMKKYAEGNYDEQPKRQGAEWVWRTGDVTFKIFHETLCDKYIK